MERGQTRELCNGGRGPPQQAASRSTAHKCRSKRWWSNERLWNGVKPVSFATAAVVLLSRPGW